MKIVKLFGFKRGNLWATLAWEKYYLELKEVGYEERFDKILSHCKVFGRVLICNCIFEKSSYGLSLIYIFK